MATTVKLTTKARCPTCGKPTQWMATPWDTLEPTLCLQCTDDQLDHEILSLHGEDMKDHNVPTYSGSESRKELFRKWGAPNVAPRPGESPFGDCRVLFVDDTNDGKPIAYWVRKL